MAVKASDREVQGEYNKFEVRDHFRGWLLQELKTLGCSFQLQQDHFLSSQAHAETSNEPESRQGDLSESVPPSTAPTKCHRLLPFRLQVFVDGFEQFNGNRFIPLD